ncbi:hypothetical protein ACJMK2_024105 [Sinanodonta woodiana]|uniref:Plexin domain-containing protein 2 n=1 Tax=Sinanodonta woodiana TaxID=1069815 RepID=A0ABD3T7C3_SINWO
MEAVESALFNLLFLFSISVELHGIHVGEKDLRYSSLRDQHVIVLDSSERYRRQAPIAPNPLPSQNISQTEGTTVKATNTTRNEVNTTTSVPLPTTSTPQTDVVNDTHEYYTMTIMQNQADNYWVELSNATLHQDLRNASKKAQTIQFLNASYLFYGHQIYNVTITTGGFLYMSPFVHSFLAATQYIAPLMADFGTMGNNSDIYFQEYANQFIVEWRNVYLVDQGDFGPFKFQTILYKNGSVAFIYQKVPVSVSNISTFNHPVKIGLADAFYIDTKPMRGPIMRTVYNYHTIKVNFTTVKPKTVIILHPLASCNMAKDCYTCVTQTTAFKCLWCAKVQRCSDSFDWFRQEWLESGCQLEGHNSTDFCNSTTSKPTPNATTTARPSTTETPGPDNKTSSIKTQSTPTPSQTIPSVPAGSTTGLATNQTTNIRPLSSTPQQITTSETTPKANTLKNQTSPMSITNSTIHSTKITTLLTSNTTTSQTKETTSPNPTSHNSATVQTTPATTTLKKVTANITTQKPTTLRQDTSQILTTNTTTATTTVAPCNKTKNGTCGQGAQPITQNQVELASGSRNASMIAMLVILGLIVLGSLVAFFVYAYRNPTSAPGQWLIQNRPSALRERIKNVRNNFFKSFSDSSEKYRLESESEL